MKYGFSRVASAIPSVKVADINYNISEILLKIKEAAEKNVEAIVFPELSVTGYTCQDLFNQSSLLNETEKAVAFLLEETKSSDIISIIGLPLYVSSKLYNAAAIIQSGKILGFVSKTYLPNYGEFYEQRWFTSSQNRENEDIEYAGCKTMLYNQPVVFRTKSGMSFGVEICEDLWATIPPSTTLAQSGAEVIFNLSATDELIGKHSYLCSLIKQQSARLFCAYLYSSCGFGESTQDVVYGGNAIISENGNILSSSRRFSFMPQLVIADIDYGMLRSERQYNSTFRNIDVNKSVTYVECEPNKEWNEKTLYRMLNPTPFIPSDNNMKESCEEIFNIQVAGLAKRLIHTNSKTVILGISGGLDSTLALLVCVKTFDKLKLDKKGITGVTMPGFGTSDRTYNNAVMLMNKLNINMIEISIKDAVLQHFRDIDHNPDNHDVTYENSQARERTQILMDLANKCNGMVIGTGDMSELALGWATYNGDHMSMYGVNAGVPKTLIRYLVRYVAENEVDNETSNTLLDIIDTPISPELTPANTDGTIQQKTEDLVGPYELHDFYLYYVMRYGFTPSKIFYLATIAFADKYDKETILKWLKTFYRRFFSQQFKRSCLPDGPKVGSVSLSPRGDWRMPSDASSAVWQKECESLTI